MPIFEDDNEIFKEWWNSFPINPDSFSKEGIAYEAWKAAAQRYKKSDNAELTGRCQES